ncbi:hypothetical protein TYRP_018388 [Tyrophagus putrescentiae]|nr:hypothetical protein TYRP_018388 [Tyrophagus putrescentiae]
MFDDKRQTKKKAPHESRKKVQRSGKRRRKGKASEVKIPLRLSHEEPFGCLQNESLSEKQDDQVASGACQHLQSTGHLQHLL